MAFRVRGMTSESFADLGQVGLGKDRRLSMCQELPNEYHEALMDDDYMKDLLLAVEKQGKKRKNATDRYVRMNQTILVILIIQALFGIFLALWMTVLQPQFSFASDLNLEDVDMVIMMDASAHSGAEREAQVNAVETFTKSLYTAMHSTTEKKMNSTIVSLLQEKYKHLTWLQNLWTPVMDVQSEDQIQWAKDNIFRSRGYLRIATSLFNADFYSPAGANSGFPGLLHNLSYDQDAQNKALDELVKKTGQQDPYKAHAQWDTAMKQCYGVMRDATTKGIELEKADPVVKKRMGNRCWKPQPGKDEKSCDFYKNEEECPKRYCQWETIVNPKNANDKQYLCREKAPLCRRQYCIIIGDGDAMCSKHGASFNQQEYDQCKTFTMDTVNTKGEKFLSTEELSKYCTSHMYCTWNPSAKTCQAGVRYSETTSKICEKARQKDPNTKLCPSKESMQAYGSAFEFGVEMDICKDYYTETMLAGETDAVNAAGLWDVDKLNQKEDVKLIMMFLVANERERQLRLGNPTLKRFIENTLKCQIHAQTTEWKNPQTGATKAYPSYELDKSCTQFTLALNFGELAEQADRVAALLKADATVAANPNASKDLRYLFFLILPLNLFFYLGWTTLIRMYASGKQAIEKASGKKKKMIKVTKNLIEKVEEPVGQALLGDMELGEIEKLKVPIEFGASHTIRARLKGGYIRNHEKNNDADGGGKPFDPNAFFTFEPTDDTGMTHYPIESGVPFRIKNNHGQFLLITPEGTKWVEHPDPNGNCEFCIEQFSASSGDLVDELDMPRVYLGDTALIRCNATGKFLKISKEGKIDGDGERTQAECQVVVDSGGLPMTTGTIVTIATDMAHLPLHCSPKGAVRVGLEGDEDQYFGHAGEWVHWLIEKKSLAAQMGYHPDLHVAAGSAYTAHANRLAAPVKDHAMEDDKSEMSDCGSASGDLEGTEIAHEFSLAAQGEIIRKMSTIQDPKHNRDILREGDVIQIKAANGHYLEVSDDGKSLNAGRAELGGVGSASKFYTREFVVHKLGVSKITKHNQIIRRGEKVCFRPHKPSGDKMDNHVKINDNEDGVEATGTLFDKDIAFIFDIAGIMPCVDPLTDALKRGDCEIMYSPLWDKKNIQRCEAMSAAWCEDGDLKKIEGIVVVASGTSYTVPKGKQPWAAVVEDGVDVYKAAAQLKSQGATGIIIRCENPCEMERLALGADHKNAPPVLPVVFVSKKLAEGLNEKGLTLKGCEFRKKYVTDVMRAIGRAPLHKGKVANTDVFNAAAKAMLEREKELKIWKEKEAEKKRLAQMQQRDEEEEAAGGDNFKWKVNTKTNYMGRKVDYGKKAPPSAQKKKVVLDADGKEIHHIDAGTGRHTVNRASIKQKTGVKTTRMSVVCFDASDVASKNRDKLKIDGMSELVEDAGDMEMEELGEDSDFKIDYKFEEIEVDVHAKVEELGEDEEMMGEGVETVRIGVPRKQFWMVAAGLAVSTIILLIILIAVMCKPTEVPPKPTDAEATQDVYGMADMDLQASFDSWVVGPQAVALNQAFAADVASPKRYETVADALAASRTDIFA